MDEIQAPVRHVCEACGKLASDHRGWRRVCVPQPALSRHLSGMTSELALPGLELPGEQQGHGMAIPTPSPSWSSQCLLHVYHSQHLS